MSMTLIVKKVQIESSPYDDTSELLRTCTI